MDSLTLIYSENPATGLPRLEAPGGNLDPDDLDFLQQQVHHLYHELVGTPGGQVVTLKSPRGVDLPNHYRVTVRWQDGQRCPTLVLNAVDQTEAAPGEPNGHPALGAGQAPSNWQVGFFSELAEMLAASEPAGRKKSALDFALGDLRAVMKKNPKVLTLLLFAGYLEAADAICRRHGTPLENKYVQAARWMKERFGDLLPEGALDLLVE